MSIESIQKVGSFQGAGNVVYQNLVGSPTPGDLWFDYSNVALKMYNGVDWTAFSNTTGDITGVTAGLGLSGGGLSGVVTLDLDFSELTNMTGDISGTTEFIIQDGSTESRKAASGIKLSAFNNDSGWTDNDGTVTSIATSGTINGITLTGGPITDTGTITLGGTLSGIILTQLDPAAVILSSESFADINTAVLTAAATDDRILSYGYSTTTGTVTSIATSGSVNGITLTGGPITEDGTITLGGAINNLLLNQFDPAAVILGTESFLDTDTAVLTAAATDDRILSYGYSTTTGTVTSIGVSGGAGLTSTGGPITSSGTITLAVGAGTGLTVNANDIAITNTGVTAQQYGDAATIPVVTVNAQGQITLASEVSIAIDASQITSGTIDTDRLTDVTLDNVTDNGNTTTNDITVGNLTSTGIDDNATETTMTISPDENVAFGTGITSPTYQVDIYDGPGAQNIFRARQSGSTNGFTIKGDGSEYDYQMLDGDLEVIRSGTTGVSSIEIGGATVANARRGGFFKDLTTYDMTYNNQLNPGVVVGKHIFKNGPDTHMVIDSFGNMGIGTNVPTHSVTVKGQDFTGAPTAGAYGTLGLISGGSLGSGGSVTFGAGQSDNGFAAIKGHLANGATNSQGDLAFYTRNAVTDAAMSERLRIKSTGNVGIGTTTPSRELQIKLADDTTTTLGQKGGIGLYAPSNTVGNGGEVIWSSGSNSEVWAAISGHIVANSAGLASGHLIFATADAAALPTERMRITDTGHLLVGRTSTTAASTDYGTQLYGNGVIYQFAESTGSSDIHRWYNGAGTKVAYLQGDGDLIMNGGAVQTTILTTGSSSTAGTMIGDWTLPAGSTFQATYADLAEKYTTDAEYESGTVMKFGGDAELTQSDTTNDHKVAGVLSTNPAYILNAEIEGQYLALSGRVPVKVTGSVSPGDILVSSNVPGHAEVNNDARSGRIIGKAITNDANGVCEALVTLM